jgi:hypothetical protein
VRKAGELGISTRLIPDCGIGGADNEEGSDDDNQQIATEKDFYTVLAPVSIEFCSLASIEKQDEILAYIQSEIVQIKKAKNEEDRLKKKPSKSREAGYRRRLITTNPQLEKSETNHGNKRKFL